MLCTDKIPRNSVIISPSPHITNFFIPSQRRSSLRSGSAPEAAVMPMIQPVSGIITADVSRESTCIAVRVTELYTAADAV